MAEQGTAVKLLTLAQHENKVLVYDPTDVESMEYSTPCDVHELPDNGSGVVRRELGQAHVHLSLHFKPGKRARWISLAELAEHSENQTGAI